MRMGSLKQYASPAGWVLLKEESSIAPDGVWSNRDLDPSPVADRRWTSWTFFAYWISDLVNPGAWATVSSFVAIGLTWWEACLAVFTGGLLVALLIAANAWVGATIHTPFAVTSRSVFGYWGSKFVVFSRMACACFWTSINSWAGGVFISLMIRSIWPSFGSFRNDVPASQGATSANFLCFFIFWALQLPLTFIHPSKLGPVFTVKAVLVPLCALAMLVWALIAAGPERGAALSNPIGRAAPGKERFVAFMYSVTAVQAAWATLSLNIGDFSRYCKHPRSVYVQVWALPAIFSIMSIFGSITAACCQAIYGIPLYQAYDIIDRWDGSPGGRAAMFFASAIWALAIITTNITANSISAANDLTSLVPKYINIRRGQLLAMTVGVFGFAPWKVLASAGTFLTFMASYAVVIAPISGIMAFDFFFIKKRRVNIYQMYQPDGIYSFYKGWNWRAYAALIVGLGPNIPGMVNALSPDIDVGGAQYIYMMSNTTAICFGVFTYWILNLLSPPVESFVTEPIHDYIDAVEIEVFEDKHKLDAEADIAKLDM